jgi:hypothetical protein
MSSGDAIGLFGAYTTILSVLVGFGTLLLQALLNEATAFKRDYGEDRSARLWFVARVLSAIAVIGSGSYLVSELTMRVGQAAAVINPSLMSFPVGVLDGIFVLIAAAYLTAIVRTVFFRGW